MEGSKNGVSRRKFIGGMAAASAFAVVPRHVLGGVGFVAPSDKINIAQIGAGTQAIRQLNGGIMQRDDIRITSVTDPNRETQDYVDWSRLGTRRSTRRLLGDDSWGEGDTGTRGGRDYVKRIIDTYYAESGESDGVRTYEDYREMLAAEDDADAVVIIVPDHLHAHISIAAMKAGKAVIMHKPVGLSPHEVRRVLETEKETGAVTHMLAYSAPENHGRLKAWLEIGAIGRVLEVHNWTNRPVWPQAWPDYPQEQAGIPDGFNWDLWQGPIPHQDYHPLLTHTLYRGWYNYGAGCLGDMGNYSLWQPHRFLKLGAPDMVEAYTSKSVILGDDLVCQTRHYSPVAFPSASQIHFRHPRTEDRPEVDVYWYSGSMKPQTPEELFMEDGQLPGEGMLFVGSDGKILCGFRGGNPRLLPEGRMASMNLEEEEVREMNQDDEWTEAVRTNGHSRGAFSEAASLAEATALGIAAVQNPATRLLWDSENMTFTNADVSPRRTYREGWEL